MSVSFSASDFFKRGDLYFPRKISMQYYANGKEGFYQNHEVIDLAAVNSPIPDSAFIVDLPVGTHVLDARGGGQSSLFFEIKKDGPIPEDLQDVIAVLSPPFWKRTWVTGLGLGVAIAIAGLITAYLLRRFFLRRKQA